MKKIKIILISVAIISVVIISIYLLKSLNLEHTKKLPINNTIKGNNEVSNPSFKEGTKNYSSNQSTFYDPKLIEIADSILGLTVQDCIISQEGNEQISFSGDFTVTGEVVINTVGGSDYVILCNDDEVRRKLPFSYSWDQNFTRRFPFILLDNQKKMDDIIDDTISKELLMDDGKRYKVTILCNNFDYGYNSSEYVMSKISIKDIITIDEMVISDDEEVQISEIDFKKVKIDIVVAMIIDINEEGELIIEDVNGGYLISMNDYGSWEDIKRLRPWRRYTLQLNDKLENEQYNTEDYIKLTGYYNPDTNTIIQSDDDHVMLRYIENY
ncbi:MAG: hypothetical protein CVV02_08555 [Firmicutes bacterium HGW-Firmicutes-7]|nr:MAG: hypothetical protein CVV02_08555 [Firmicutes bacterium HGW-Firmicutes-7]